MLPKLRTYRGGWGAASDNNESPPMSTFEA